LFPHGFASAITIAVIRYQDVAAADDHVCDMIHHVVLIIRASRLDGISIAVIRIRRKPVIGIETQGL
jgi:hypothetical protein